MKLYYFNPHTYGAQYFVMAKSPEEAYQSVLIYLKKAASSSDNGSVVEDDFKKWYNYTHKNLPSEYTIDEYSEGVVVESEIC